jgi:hypothetical protein
LSRIIVILLLLPIVYFAAIFAASEWGGEVVELETTGPMERSFQTSLWIVDFDRASWVRAGNPGAEWLHRLRADPIVYLDRNGERKAYRAEVFNKLGNQVNQAMRKKYGRADQLLCTWLDPQEVVAVRLVEE